MTTEEIWKIIPSTDGKYAVSNLGRIRFKRACKTKVIERITIGNKGSSTGYLMLDLRKTPVGRMVTVHSLVAFAFLGERPVNNVVNHLDHDRQNNVATNLEYTTQKGNVQHAWAAGRLVKPPVTQATRDKLSKALTGRPGIGRKLNRAQVRRIKQLRAKGLSFQKLANKFGVSKKAMMNLLSGKTYPQWQ